MALTSDARRPPTIVLVVDDSELSRTMARQDLSAAGFRVLTADTIEEGLAAARSRQVHVVLLDIELPRARGGRREPRGGIDAIREFAREAPASEIVMVSQHDHAELGMEALRQGACDYLVKPYLPEQLTSTVQRALERRRSQREIERLRRELYDLKGGPLFFGRGSPGSVPAKARFVCGLRRVARGSPPSRRGRSAVLNGVKALRPCFAGRLRRPGSRLREAHGEVGEARRLGLGA